MPVTSLRKTCVRPPEVAKVRAAPGLAQLSLAGCDARLSIGNGNGNGNGREGKGREGKGREGKGREGKGR
ncbi:hypothetical protein PRtIB026_A14550 [Pseudomonas sp. RtIB026]|nr:hypothetical protein PRtIB026_A14550 [Pseudomonas sp. RtIB026]